MKTWYFFARIKKKYIPAQVVQLGVQFHGVFMSVRLHDLLFIVIPSNVRSGFPDQPAFENDFVGFLFRLPDDWPFCKGGLNATLGNGSLFAYWNRKNSQKLNFCLKVSALCKGHTIQKSSKMDEAKYIPNFAFT